MVTAADRQRATCTTVNIFATYPVFSFLEIREAITVTPAMYATFDPAIEITGVVNQEDRAPYCGHEIHADAVEIISPSENYPITRKPHGDAFLMDHRHLWLRSRKQNLILRVRATLVK